MITAFKWVRCFNAALKKSRDRSKVVGKPNVTWSLDVNNIDVNTNTGTDKPRIIPVSIWDWNLQLKELPNESRFYATRHISLFIAWTSEHLNLKDRNRFKYIQFVSNSINSLGTSCRLMTPLWSWSRYLYTSLPMNFEKCAALMYSVKGTEPSPWTKGKNLQMQLWMIERHISLCLFLLLKFDLS